CMLDPRRGHNVANLLNFMTLAIGILAVAWVKSNFQKMAF
ncbi:MAG: hypothetical protein JWM28_3897, partial [Chitinophagaceae bacterium]|nr:hypothetical protein [Chitinophagaceae bacterium]